jgi:hypothetical protein
VSDRDLDAEFARIIAGWDDEAPDPQLHGVDGPVRSGDQEPQDEAVAVDEPDASSTDAEPGDSQPARPEPVAGIEQPEPPQQEPQQPEPQQPTTGAAGPAGSSGLLELPISPTASHAWRGSTPPREEVGDVGDDDHFVPPSEIDLPSAETDPMFWAIVGGLAGGPLLLLYVLFFDRDGSGWWVVTAVTMLVVGFVLLVLRGGNERDPFDDGTRV